MHVIIRKLRGYAEHDRMVGIKDVIDDVERVDAAVGQEDIIPFDINLVLPEFCYRIVQCVAVRIWSQTGRVEIFKDFGALRRKSVWIAALTAVDAAFRKLDVIHSIAYYVMLKQLLFYL